MIREFQPNFKGGGNLKCHCSPLKSFSNYLNYELKKNNQMFCMYKNISILL